MEVVQIGNIAPHEGNWDNPQSGRVYSVSGLAPTINTCGGGNLEPKIITREIRSAKPKKSFLIAALRGRNPDKEVDTNWQLRLEINTKGISNTLTTVYMDTVVLEITEE